MLFEIVDRLIALMGPIAAYRGENREMRDNALRAVSIALTETKIYAQRLARGHGSRDTEEQLARYWQAASIPLRHIDQDFSEICMHKSEYWISPGQYTAEELTELGARLSDVSRAYKQLALNRNR